MDRRRFLRNTALAGTGLAAAGCQSLSSPASSSSSAPAERPNILLIVADDMGFSDVGSYGSEIETPNVDSLAQDGLRFSQFYNHPRCSPSRAAMLTGLYPHQAGMGDLATTNLDNPAYLGHLNDQCVTTGEVLQEEGYHTLMAGKWHLGHRQESYWPSRRGFDRFYGEHRYVNHYFRPTHQLYLDGENVEPEGPYWYSTDAYTDHMLDFMEETQEDEKPFFAYMAFNAPHFSLQAMPEDIAKYRGQYMNDWDRWRRRRYERQIEMGLIDEQWTLPDDSLLHSDRERVEKWLAVEDDSPDMWDMKMAAYAAQVDRMDQNIGRLLRKLETMGVAENTLVMFLSDNGGCAEDWINSRNPEGVLPGEPGCELAYGPYWANVSNTPFRFYKRWTHEGGIATPFIARWPGVIEQRGALHHEMGHVMDIMATCLDAAGATYPDTYDGNDILPLEGKSLLPAFQGDRAPLHDEFYWEHIGNRAARQGDWKIVSRPRFGDGEWELYNLAADRTETNNLADRHPDRVEAMAADYERFAERTGVVPWEELTE
jgi:arylsulfatase